MPPSPVRHNESLLDSFQPPAFRSIFPSRFRHWSYCFGGCRCVASRWWWGRRSRHGESLRLRKDRWDNGGRRDSDGADDSFEVTYTFNKKKTRKEGRSRGRVIDSEVQNTQDAQRFPGTSPYRLTKSSSAETSRSRSGPSKRTCWIRVVWRGSYTRRSKGGPVNIHMRVAAEEIERGELRTNLLDLLRIPHVPDLHRSVCASLGEEGSKEATPFVSADLSRSWFGRRRGHGSRGVAERDDSRCLAWSPYVPDPGGGKGLDVSWRGCTETTMKERKGRRRENTNRY
jgi:hypothetical protein